MSILRVLNEANKMPIYSIEDERFKTYGRIVENYDFSELISYMEEKSEMPDEGNVYKASVKEMEDTKVFETVKENLYGGMDIEVGYCNGLNSKLNGFEYHKGSEINIAITDMVLILGHTWDIANNSYNVDNVDIFYIPKGAAIEMYETTLHLSPCKVSDDGFKAVVILPRGTNTTLAKRETKKEKVDLLLLMKNKWVIAHPERKKLLDQGAVPGIVGENIEVKYR